MNLRLELGEDGSHGRWVMPDVSYVSPHRRFCAFCGRPIARRYWQTLDEEDGRIYCDPAHAALHTTYPQRPRSDGIGDKD